MAKKKAQNKFIITTIIKLSSLMVFFAGLLQLCPAQGKWVELNPKIPRVGYQSTYFFNPDTGWAVGDNGAIIYTKTGGREWIKQNSGVNEILLRVHSYDGKTVIAAGFNGTVLRSVNEGKNWEKIPVPVTGNIWCVRMLDEKLGWACGTSTSLIKTTDGGVNWQYVETGYPGIWYWDMAFLSKDTFYVSCTGGVFLKTEDGGKTWIFNSVNKNISLYTIKVFNPQRIVAGGGEGYIAYTDDGGKSWSYSQLDISINSFAFVNDSLGYALGTDDLAILRTTDGGKKWKYFRTEPRILVGRNHVSFVNDSVGYITGGPIILLKTTDGGYTWNSVVIRDDFMDVWFLSPEEGFVLSPPGLYKTSDRGEKWEKVSDTTGGTSIFFIDKMTGFIGGLKNQIYKTTDGGISWQNKNITGKTDSNFSINKIAFPDKKNGYAVGYKNTFKTTDGGENWFLINLTGGRALSFIDSLTGWVLSNPIIKTTDGGLNWVTLPRISYEDAFDIYFKNKNEGIITLYNQLFKTTDGGEAWTADDKCKNYQSAYFGFLTKDHGFILGTKHFETTDGGNSWTDISQQIGTSLQRFHSPAENIGYAIGQDGLIMRYYDSTITSVKKEPFQKVNEIQLSNYPNPFNNSTKIKFISNIAGKAAIKIYNALGQLIKIFTVNDAEPNRVYEIDFDASRLSSGVYFYQLSIGDKTKIQKALLLK
jgi:photosystem II stability/assembly factor-like uncharacterized protein